MSKKKKLDSLSIVEFPRNWLKRNILAIWVRFGFVFGSQDQWNGKPGSVSDSKWTAPIGPSFASLIATQCLLIFQFNAREMAKIQTFSGGESLAPWFTHNILLLLRLWLDIMQLHWWCWHALQPNLFHPETFHSDWITSFPVLHRFQDQIFSPTVSVRRGPEVVFACKCHQIHLPFPSQGLRFSFQSLLRKDRSFFGSCSGPAKWFVHSEFAR